MQRDHKPVRQTQQASRMPRPWFRQAGHCCLSIAEYLLDWRLQPQQARRTPYHTWNRCLLGTVSRKRSWALGVNLVSMSLHEPWSTLSRSLHLSCLHFHANISSSRGIPSINEFASARNVVGSSGLPILCRQMTKVISTGSITSIGDTRPVYVRSGTSPFFARCRIKPSPTIRSST
jgi:hypothetical protein